MKERWKEPSAHRVERDLEIDIFLVDREIEEILQSLRHSVEERSLYNE